MFSVLALLQHYYNMAAPGNKVEVSNDLTDGKAVKHPSGTTSSVKGPQVEVNS